MSAQEPPKSSGISPSVGYMVMVLLCSAGLLSIVYANPNETPGAAPTTESPPPPAPAAPPPKPSATAPAPTASVPEGNLLSEDMVVGSGSEPVKSGDQVTVHYVGTLMNGTEFDASRKHGDEGFTFKIGKGQVIAGWDQGVQGMRVGGKRRLTIPPSLAYGQRGSPPAIPPNSTLQFVVEVIKVSAD